MRRRRFPAASVLLLTLILSESLIADAHFTELHGDNQIRVLSLIDTDGRIFDTSKSIIDYRCFFPSRQWIFRTF